MIKFIDVSGKTEEEAVKLALARLSMDRDDVSVEILERAKSGFLGIGSTPATVRVSYDDGMPEAKEEPKAEEKPKEKLKAEKPAPVYRPEVLQKEVRAREKVQHEEKKVEKKAEKKPAAALGDEVQGEKADQIRAFLKGLLEQMDSAADVKIYEVEKGRYKVFLEGEKLGALIGRRGETLDAIQQLTSYAVNRGSDKSRVRIQIDAENYREKREESLERLANKVAAKVTKYRRNVTLEPMNAYERHVIHTALQEVPSITTFSIGTEPNRRVVVSYDRNK